MAFTMKQYVQTDLEADREVVRRPSSTGAQHVYLVPDPCRSRRRGVSPRLGSRCLSMVSLLHALLHPS